MNEAGRSLGKATGVGLGVYLVVIERRLGWGRLNSRVLISDRMQPSCRIVEERAAMAVEGEKGEREQKKKRCGTAEFPPSRELPD